MRGAVAEFRQVEAFQNIEDFDQRDPARRWRRSADNVVAAIGPANRLALFHFVVREVVGSNEASTFRYGGGEFAGHGAVIEVIRIFCNPLQRAGEFRLLQSLAWLIIFAVALKDALRCGELGKVVVAQILGVFPGKGEAVARKLDCRSHHFFERELAVFFLGVDESGDRAGDANCFVADQTGVFDHVALGVEIHVLARGRGRLFAKVDEVDFAIRFPQQQKPTSTEIARLRMDHSERKPSGHGGVHCVAASLHDLDSGARCQLVYARDHRMRRVNGTKRGRSQAAGKQRKKTESGQ